MKTRFLILTLTSCLLNAGVAADAPAKKSAKPPLSPGIAEILKMAESGIAADVMKSYVEGSSTKYVITANDVILMKEKGVPDEVTAAVLQRFNEQRKKTAAIKRQPPVMPRIVERFSTPGRLDPESYEFFLMHHLYPRTLSSSYSRLAPYQNRRFQNRGRNFRGRSSNFRRGINDR